MKILKPLKFTRDNVTKKRRNRKTLKRKSFINKIIRRKKPSNKKLNRDKKIKRRKNFIPLVFLTIISWTATLYIVFFVDPVERGSLQLFFFSIFFSLLFTFFLIFTNKRRALVLAVSVIFFLILRYFGIGNIINIFLILGLVATAEMYFSKN